jgi:DNA polymerase-3 subunit delta'
MSTNYPLEQQTGPLPWQRDTWQSVRGAMQRDRLGHALLISGTPGTGRNLFAMALARLLLCSHPTENGNCGSCKGCELTRRGAHADFSQLAPEEEGKSIGIDAVRSMLGFSSKTSSLGMRKVVLVAPLEAMTANAFNAFLKSLEEPSAGTYYLLVHARGRRIPATVRSRCQRLNLAVPNHSEACAWLEAALETEGRHGDASVLLELANGRPLHALASGVDSDSVPQRALRAALTTMRDSPGIGGHEAALSASSAATPAQLLEQLQELVHGMLRESGRVGEKRLMRVQMQALDTIRGLEAAHLSGTNPNPELLRFGALDAYADACEGYSVDATLRAK